MNNEAIIANFPDDVRSDTYAIDYGRVAGLVSAPAEEAPEVKAEAAAEMSDEELLEAHRTNLRRSRTGRRHGSARPIPGAIAIAREVMRRGLSV